MESFPSSSELVRSSQLSSMMMGPTNIAVSLRVYKSINEFVLSFRDDHKENCLLGILPKPVDPPLGTFRNKNVTLEQKIGFSRPRTMATEISHQV